MELIQTQVSIILSRTQLLDVVQEALSTKARADIITAITPVLEKAFPQFAEFKHVIVGETTETGMTTITLSKTKPGTPAKKAAVTRKPKTPKPKPEPTPVEESTDPFGDTSTITPEYVDYSE